MSTSPNLQISKSPNLQISKSPNLQISKSPKVQMSSILDQVEWMVASKSRNLFGEATRETQATADDESLLLLASFVASQIKRQGADCTTLIKKRFLQLVNELLEGGSTSCWSSCQSSALCYYVKMLQRVGDPPMQLRLCLDICPRNDRSETDPTAVCAGNQRCCVRLTSLSYLVLLLVTFSYCSISFSSLHSSIFWSTRLQWVTLRRQSGREYPNIQISKCPNVQMSKCPNIQISETTHAHGEFCRKGSDERARRYV